MSDEEKPLKKARGRSTKAKKVVRLSPTEIQDAAGDSTAPQNPIEGPTKIDVGTQTEDVKGKKRPCSCNAQGPSAKKTKVAKAEKKVQSK